MWSNDDYTTNRLRIARLGAQSDCQTGTPERPVDGPSEPRPIFYLSNLTSGITLNGEPLNLGNYILEI